MKYLFLLSALFLAWPSSAQSFVKQPDDKFEWRIIGRALFDAGIFSDDVTSLGNGVSFTDGRIGVIARFLEDWEGKVEFGYSRGNMGIRDVYIAYHWGNSRVKAGHFFEPFGIGGRVGTSDTRLMNIATTASVFGDRRKIGVAYTYNCESFTAAGGFFSDTDVNNIKAENSGYALAGKIFGRPFYDKDRLLHLGFSTRFSGYGRSERDSMTLAGGLPTAVLTSAVNRFLETGITGTLNQWKWGAELIFLYKNLYLQSEYSSAYYNRRSSFENYIGDGIYVQAGILLLGDKRYNYSRTQGWITNPSGGNLEFLLRYNYTSLNDRSADLMGGKLQDITVGINYFINRFVAVRLNYTHASLDENARNGKESMDYIQMRAQFNF